MKKLDVFYLNPIYSTKLDLFNPTSNLFNKSPFTFHPHRSNLLTSLPRELCFLPIQVLLVSNNRLTSLPDELNRMEQLTELDAACNQITHLPARMSDLKNLKSLSLRNNHLVYLPRGKPLNFPPIPPLDFPPVSPIEIFL